MRLIVRVLALAVLAAVLAAPAGATVTVEKVMRIDDGLCTNVTSTGGAEVRVRVAGLDSAGSLAASWTAAGVHSITVQPVREMVEAIRATDRGRDAQGRQRWSVWISASPAQVLPFVVEVLEGGNVIDTRNFAAIPAGTDCPAAPSLADE